MPYFPTRCSEISNWMYLIADEAVIRHVSQTNKRRRGPAPQIINCDVYVNLEGSSGSMVFPLQFVVFFFFLNSDSLKIISKL